MILKITNKSDRVLQIGGRPVSPMSTVHIDQSNINPELVRRLVRNNLIMATKVADQDVRRPNSAQPMIRRTRKSKVSSTEENKSISDISTSIGANNSDSIKESESD